MFDKPTGFKNFYSHVHEGRDTDLLQPVPYVDDFYSHVHEGRDQA